MQNGETFLIYGCCCTRCLGMKKGTPLLRQVDMGWKVEDYRQPAHPPC